ncbi:beta-1,3-galactosyl-O-glycosyl-glycoprotein beta-1,6-N-acetylglucosaminyltransferase 3-like isoform X1 [Haliotis rufescens]|uniref:beta-1,3-galactosyl-O-glycosyl-glycoprotein beta-1,6-N-acetylglucosaminyltransferase 3-like isoform X1 n=2 Tax=Haliotis rufescens TaxID=6454 RepID=UPI001EAFAB2D|nr:beta-1,3-galactosyl-O-glycosyl-glycoprotein beta-1,6-N-acetylglucosaminyltransferase 3-like isoform X1 [Haliotis rufescens]
MSWKRVVLYRRVSFRKLVQIFVMSSMLILLTNCIYWNEDFVRNVLISLRTKRQNLFLSVSPSRSEANCSAIFRGDRSETLRAKSLPPRHSIPPFSQSVLAARMQCEEFKRSRGYILNATPEELEFPLAFSILMYKDMDQMERLLRAIYRPHNVYCVHVDLKSPISREVATLLQCFDNVHPASRRVNVVWGEYSVLEADLICMEDLLAHANWKYFINLTGQEYPLKTNYQIVQVLKSFKGANNVAGTLTRYNENYRRWSAAGPPPRHIRPVMGSVHVLVNRVFVQYAITNPTAKDLLDWVKQTLIPDETFFPTLNYNAQLGIPGTHTGEPHEEPFPARYKNWDHGLWFYLDDCQGKYLREICIVGVGDLPSLTRQKHLFVNKFLGDFEPAALDCIEEWYFDTIKKENNGPRHFDTSFYEAMDFVRNKV